MVQTLKSSDNWQADRVDGRVELRVWVRRDLSMERGAELANELSEFCGALATDRLRRYHGLVADLTGAPFVCGPITEAALGRLAKAWADASRRIAIVAEDPLQVFQMEGIIAANARATGRVVPSLEAARTWCDGGR